MNGKAVRLLVIILIAGLIGTFFALDLGQYLTFAYFKSKYADFQEFYSRNRIGTWAAYMGIYVVTTALSLPGAAILTIAGGALFGVLTGTILVSFSSTIGATLAFLAARFIAHDFVQKRFGDKLEPINRGVKRDGWFYLLTLRLIPVFPFFVINLVMALTPIRTLTFYAVSQLGMLPGTIVYVNAGAQLAEAGIQAAEKDAITGLLTPELIGSFVLLALIPWIGKKIILFLKARKAYRGFRRPKSYDYNLVVIGAGSAGLVSAYIAATVKAKVALIEKNKMGGDCLNTGCVPSKALIRSSRIMHDIHRSEEFGIRRAEAEFSFADVMERVQRVIRKVEPHDSVERYTKLGVDCIAGEARLLTPWKIEVTDPDGSKRTLTTKNVIIATGGRPAVPPLPGLDETGYLTSDTLWEIREQPRRLLVLGGGPIGSELAQAFARLGSDVTQVEMHDRIMGREDDEFSDMVMKQFRREGIRVLTRHKAKRFGVDGSTKHLIAEKIDEKGDVLDETRVEFDEVLVALGRRANTAGLGLEEIGIRLNPNGTIDHDEQMRTAVPNIFVCGDVAGPYQFTHTAAHQAWYAAVNALFSPLKTFRADYSVIPWATFTDPEIAHVGLNEKEAREKGIEYEVTTYGIDDLDRAMAEEEDRGLVKVLTAPGKDKILGATIGGAHAGELITEFITAMKNGIGLNKILGTIHIYPTMSEANKFAAGEWKKARKPERALKVLRSLFDARRGI